MKKIYIYILRDPESLKTMYVGKTTSKIKRILGHLNEIATPQQRKWNKKRSAWYASLLERDQLPLFDIIETTYDEKYANDREIYWIDYYSSPWLTNSTFNKRNPPNWTHSNEKEVYAYNEYTKQVTVYSNVSTAAKAVDTKPKNIYSAIHIKGRTKDLFWAYHEDAFEEYNIKPWINRRLVRVTKNGESKVYKNVQQAAKILNIEDSKHNALTKIRKGLLKEYNNFHFEMIGHLKPGELLEDCDVNQQPSSENNIKVSEKVQRLDVEEFTNKTSTSAGHSMNDDIV